LFAANIAKSLARLYCATASITKHSSSGVARQWDGHLHHIVQ
jgi:hypothetical protein